MSNKYISEADQEKLEVLFDAGASRMASEPEHWVCGGDGDSYCLKCCKKEVKRLLKKDPKGEYSVDGGSGSEGDGTPYCETCAKLLENTLTDCGAKEELDHFLENGFDPKSDDDCRAMSEVIGARNWMPGQYDFLSEDGKERELEYFADLHKLCNSILEKM